MIAAITGSVLTRQGDKVLILTGSGVGYEIKIGADFAVPTGDPTTVFTWHLFNEGRHEDVLFGFLTADDRELAKLVAETDGAGPGKAHALVTSAGLPMLIRAVQSGNIDELLTAVKGVGPKLLKAIIATLKEKGNFADSFGDPRTSHVRMALGVLGHEIMALDSTMDKIMRENPGATPEVIVRILLEEVRRKK